MERREVYAAARKLLDEHGLTNWTVSTELRSAHRAGECSYRDRQVRFSMKILELWSDKEAMDTITHEIAHAIVGGKHGHDWVWSAKHRELGGNGQSKWDDESTREALAVWVGTCPNGHKKYRQARSEKMRRVSCGKCSRVYDPAFHFAWVNVKTGERLPRLYPSVNAGIEALAANKRRDEPTREQSWDKGFTNIEDLFKGD